jgi:heme A synthase
MAPYAMPSPQRAAKRRADILRGLVIVVALTMALAYLTGSPLVWGVQLLTDVCLVAFLGLWAWARNVQADRAQTVRYLPRGRAPELAFRRTASS